MSDDQEIQDDELDGEEESFVRLSKKDVQQLRKAAKKSGDEAAELDRLRKERVFFKAGVDTDSPLGQLLYNGYQGELTVEAIKEQATAVGALAPAAPPEGDAPDPGPTPEERSATDERRDLAAGNQADRFRVEDPDPRKLALDRAREAIQSGRSEEDALGIAFEALIGAAQAGDTRVLWDPAA